MPRISLVGDGHGGSEDYATRALWWATESSIDYAGQVIECAMLGDCGSNYTLSGSSVNGALSYTLGVTYDGTNESSLATSQECAVSVSNSFVDRDLKYITNNSSAFAFTLLSNAWDAERIALENTTTGTGCLSVNGSYPNSSLKFFTGKGGGSVIYGGYNRGTNISNGLVYGAVNFGVDSNRTQMVITNLIAFDNGTDYKAGSTRTTCSSEDSTGDLTGYTSSELVNFAGNDYRTKSTSTLATSGTGVSYLGAFLEESSSLTIAIDSTSQPQAIESVTLTQQSSITIGGLAQAQSIEQLTLQASGTLSLNNLEQIQSIEQVNLTQAHVISVNPIDQSQELDQVSLLVAGTLTVNDTTQAQTLEQTVLSVIASLAINDITQAQEVEQVIVTAFNGSAVSIASIDQAQNIDAVTLSQLNVVSVDNLSQSQLLQAVNFNGVVVGYLQGVLTIISAYNGRIKLTNPLTGEIRIL